MPPFHRPFLGAALRGILLAAPAACCVALALWPGADTPVAPGPAGADPPARHGDEAVDLCRQAMQRAVEKQRLAAEVVEGRLSLVAAAARFRDLNAGEPAFNWQALRTTYPDCSDDERHCQEVLSFVRIELQQRPEAARALVERLEAELRDLLGRGDFRLPGPTPPAAAP
jgi:hypothetical protein